jgi:serine/threonine protein kinase
MASVSPCPDEATLQRLSAGQLDAADAQALQAHLNVCATCATQARRLGQKTEPLAPDAASHAGHDDDTAATEMRAAPSADLPARIGPYHLLGEIARGGMGRIVRVRDADFDRPLALKVLLHRGGEPEERFLREARMTGRLQHPGVPPVHALGRLDDGRPWFVMKLVEGRTLHSLLDERASPAEELQRFVSIFGQICQTVGYAHACGVIHRDLKPLNIMVGAFGEVQVMDWGLAKRLGDVEESPRLESGETAAAVHTHTGTVLGTPAYMAPEQARGDWHRVDARADVFGLGGILCAILTGKPPHDSAVGAQAYLMAAMGRLGDTETRLAGCGADPELVRLARHCLAGRPEDRPADGAAVAQAVARYQADLEQRLRQAELDRAAWAQAELQAQRLQALLEIGRRLAAERETAPMLEHIAAEAARLLRCERASIFLWDRERAQLIGRPALGLPENELRIKDDTGVVGRTVRSGQAQIVQDVRVDPAWSDAIDEASGFRTRNLLCVPMWDRGGACIGAVEVMNKPAPFTPDDVTTLKVLGEQVAAALANVRDFEALRGSGRGR